MHKPTYLGIDLGTTNSAATAFDGERLEAIRSASGEVLTPSVVRIDTRGNISVGSRARRFMHKDPDNTRAEFKRIMGSEQRCRFAAANLEKAPEELAALVLASLRRDVESQLGFSPTRAVVAVPALFELPQIRATSEAARLAGFERIETIQEPVASALASGWSAEVGRGAWLVYDLGGGTFDVSLLETQEGLLRVVGHDGDNFLGGRDVDRAIVDWLVRRIEASEGVTLERANPGHASAFGQLKAIAEEAKIELSHGARETTILVENLQLGARQLDTAEVILSAAELSELTAPLIERSLKICERLLQTHGVRNLERIVLVGGPTMMPWLRTRLQQGLNAPLTAGLDPMLLVSQGAALFAATAALDARPAAQAAQPAGPRLWLQYPAMTSDTAPFVVGRRLDDGVPLKAVRFVRSDEGWSSEWLPFEEDGTFSGMLSLNRRACSRFRVQVQLETQQLVTPTPGEITLVHGVSIGEPPLARTIGVARANDSVAVYFERGSPLPLRKTFTLRTVENVSPSAAEYALRVPIVQGDFPFAHLCRLVGVIQIPAASLKGQLPADSVIELTLEVDRGGALNARALVPAQNLVFDHVEQLVAPAIAPDTMAALLVELEKRAAALRAQGFREGQRSTVMALSDFESTAAQAKRDIEAARGGDQDAAEKARRTLIDCDGQLGDLETANAWPELTNQIYEEHTSASYWLECYGTDQEKRALQQCIEFAERALRGRNTREIERQIRTMRRICFAAYIRDPQAWSWELDHAAERADACNDPAKAQRLIQRARAAEVAGNQRELEKVVRELWALFPADPEERSLGFDSGVK
jgi:molecular chaperone DnaK